MIRLDSASFVSMYIKASVVKEVGLPIKNFLYGRMMLNIL